MFLIPQSKLYGVWMLLTTLALIDRHNRQISLKLNTASVGVNQLNNTQYDYIVVGAGTAGSIVACRLAATKHRVLLVEAGNAQHLLSTRLPGLMQLNMMRPTLYWTVRNDYTTNRSNGNQYIKSGKLFGGSHAINGMFYIKGSPKSFDSIYENTGARGWSYSDVRPYFIRTENDSKSDRNNNQTTSSPLGVSIQTYATEMFVAIESQLKNWGNKVVDYTVDSDVGIARLYRTIRNGHRLSTAMAYILNDNNNNNGLCPQLSIITDTMASKVLIKQQSEDNGQPQAYGIEFIHLTNNFTYSVYSNNEIILSSGTLNTPKLLQLSGIGEASKLSTVVDGVKPTKIWSDIPVGHNLLCHVSASFEFRLKTQSLIDTISVADLYRALLYITLSDIMEETKGNITIVSTDIWEPPVAYYPYIIRDNSPLMWATAYMFRFLETTSIDNYIDPIPLEMDDNCQQCSDGRPLADCSEYHKCLLTVSAYAGHPIGTSRMGSINRSDTVVDNRLKVKGVSRLRVVDASVFPNVIDANTMATAILVGEMGAQMIINDNNNINNNTTNNEQHNQSLYYHDDL
ncbi:oxygen-dependent choline dehydrogenase-like [Oppia nitens]|uniref:oxygen-dependent choline dehydrogenase-like n=1 Tax=Oppia nitens TaxID=1686743 RepID=UPI0023DC288B|nr:oxygen-dependent choline dehydrogenase-like [Oppia nitens]